MAKDGQRQPVEMTTAPPRTDGRAGADIGTSHLSADGDVSAPAGVRGAEELGGYVSDASAAAAGEWREARVEAGGPGGDLTAEISAAAVRHNLSLLRSLLGPGVGLCAAVKADCYGHGLDVLEPVIAAEADALAAAKAAEALRLREMGYRGVLLMLFPPGPHAPDDMLADLLAAGVRLTLVSPAEVRAVARVARLVGRAAGVHVKVDTGMGRSGVEAEAAAALVECVRGAPGVELRGLYTHLACADEADKTSARQQMACFARVAAACDTAGVTLHAANSAAVIDMPSTHLQMVRPGIAVYGYQSSDEMHNRPALRPALRLTGRLMLVKDAPEGSRCGYGQSYGFDRPSRVGLVPVGYADGYLRCFSNRATMRIAGRHVPVRGRVSMDQTLIDLTDVPEARAGDEVEIVSPRRSDPHSVESLARLAGTIPYEITCRLGSRVKRLLIDD